MGEGRVEGGVRSEVIYQEIHVYEQPGFRLYGLFVVRRLRLRYELDIPILNVHFVVSLMTSFHFIFTDVVS